MSTPEEIIKKKMISKQYRVLRTISEMLHDRGYIVSADVELNMTKEQFVEKYGETGMPDTIQTAHRNNASDQIFVFFVKKLDKGLLEEKLPLMASEKVFRAIFVANDKLTASAKKLMIGAPSKYHLEHFLDTELLVNVTKHALVPVHQVLTDEEKKTLLEKYSLVESKLPRMQIHDPVARYLGLKHGQVVKIIRPSETAGQYVCYRCVV